MELLKGTASAAEVARQDGVTVGGVERWLKASAATGGASPAGQPARLDPERKQLHAKAGELTLALDAGRADVADLAAWQQADLRFKALPSNSGGLRVGSGVHHTEYAGGRGVVQAVHQRLQGAVCATASARQH